MKVLLRAVTAAAVATALVAPRAFAQDATPAGPGTAPTAAPALPPVPAVTAPTNAPVVPAPVETKDASPSTNKSPAKATTPKKPTIAKTPVAKTQPKVDFKADAVTSPTPATAKDNVNVRGQASINSEVVGKLKKGDQITLLETVTLKKPKQDEPSQWYRIALPSAISVWVNSSYLDESGAVKPNRLNMRGGPGENYSIVGRLEKGATVKALDTKSGWTKIEPPTNAFAFVAAHLVDRQAAPMIAANTPMPEEAKPAPPVVETPAVPPVTTAPVTTAPPPTVAETAPIAPAPVTPAPAETPVTTPAPAPVPAPAETAEAPIEKVRKVVTREGTLRGSVSIQAPAYFELRSLDTGKAIAYLYSSNTNLVLKSHKGQRIIVTGEEVLDERWQHTPVMIIDELQVVR